MHKISGLNLCNFYSNFYLTKCGGCGIIVNSTRIGRARAVKKEGESPLIIKIRNETVYLNIAYPILHHTHLLALPSLQVLFLSGIFPVIIYPALLMLLPFLSLSILFTSFSLSIYQAFLSFYYLNWFFV